MKDSGNLDILRTCAVSIVVISHLFWRMGVRNYHLVTLAHLGVVVFFVHTALVLMYSLERLAGDGKGSATTRFYIRRAFRICPLSIVAVLAVYAVYYFSGPSPERTELTSARVLISNLLLIQNITGSPSIPVPLWSLAYEIQMYLVLPLIFLLLRGKSLFAAAALWAVGYYFRIYTLSMFVVCFLSGTLAYVVGAHVRPVLHWIGWPLLIFAVGWGYYLFVPEGQYDWFAALTIGFGLSFFREPPAGWLAHGAKVIAKYSFGVYVTNSPLSGFVFGRLGQYPAVVQWTVFVVASLVAPVLAYHLIEEPMILFGARVANSVALRRKPSVAMASAG